MAIDPTGHARVADASGEDARALFTGVAAHTISQMPSLVSSWCWADAGHAGTHRRLADTGGRQPGDPRRTDGRPTRTRRRVTAGEHVTAPPSGVVSVRHRADRTAVHLRRHGCRHDMQKRCGATNSAQVCAKVDFVFSGDIPWTDRRVAACADVAPRRHPRADGPAESDVAAGRHAEWPMVLAATAAHRRPESHRRCGPAPLWTYAHVPADSPIDQTETVTAIFERFAPGFRDLVVAARSVPAARLTEHNANYVGGDIGVGGTRCITRSPGRRHGSTRGARRSTASTCARRPPRRGAACTACPATTPRARCCAASSASRTCQAWRPYPRDTEADATTRRERPR